MKTLKDLFEQQLKVLYSCEKQLIQELPKIQKAAHDPELKETLDKHCEETKIHKERLEEVFKELGVKATGEDCVAMKGLIKEVKEVIAEKGGDEVKDAGLIAATQRLEHYEISGYGTVVRYAKELGHTKIASKLQKTLDEEHKADAILNEMAENRINVKAI